MQLCFHSLTKKFNRFRHINIFKYFINISRYYMGVCLLITRMNSLIYFNIIVMFTIFLHSVVWNLVTTKHNFKQLKFHHSFRLAICTVIFLYFRHIWINDFDNFVGQFSFTGQITYFLVTICIILDCRCLVSFSLLSYLYWCCSIL